MATTEAAGEARVQEGKDDRPHKMVKVDESVEGETDSDDDEGDERDKGIEILTSTFVQVPVLLTTGTCDPNINTCTLTSSCSQVPVSPSIYTHEYTSTCE